MSTLTQHSMPVLRVPFGNDTDYRDWQPILQLKELTVDAARYKAWKQWVEAQRAQERRVSLTPSERQLDSAK